MNCSKCNAGMGDQEIPWPSAAGGRCHVCGPDPIREFAKALSGAWGKYRTLFGVEPHGTESQLAALIELMGPPKGILVQHEALRACLEDYAATLKALENGGPVVGVAQFRRFQEAERLIKESA